MDESVNWKTGYWQLEKWKIVKKNGCKIGKLGGAVKWKMSCTVLVKSFAHLNRTFFLASLEEIGSKSQWGHRKFIALNV